MFEAGKNRRLPNECDGNATGTIRDRVSSHLLHGHLHFLPLVCGVSRGSDLRLLQQPLSFAAHQAAKQRQTQALKTTNKSPKKKSYNNNWQQVIKM